MKGRARWVRERDTTAHSSASNCFEKHVGESSSILADALELGEAVWLAKQWLEKQWLLGRRRRGNHS